MSSDYSTHFWAPHTKKALIQEKNKLLLFPFHNNGKNTGFTKVDDLKLYCHNESTLAKYAHSVINVIRCGML